MGISQGTAAVCNRLAVGGGVESASVNSYWGGLLEMVTSAVGATPRGVAVPPMSSVIDSDPGLERPALATMRTTRTGGREHGWRTDSRGGGAVPAARGAAFGARAGDADGRLGGARHRTRGSGTGLEGEGAPPRGRRQGRRGGRAGADGPPRGAGRTGHGRRCFQVRQPRRHRGVDPGNGERPGLRRRGSTWWGMALSGSGRTLPRGADGVEDRRGGEAVPGEGARSLRRGAGGAQGFWGDGATLWEGVKVEPVGGGGPSCGGERGRARKGRAGGAVARGSDRA